MRNAHALLDGLAKAHVGRVVPVGGAASLEVAPGKRLLDAPGFPEMYKARATAQCTALDIFRASAGDPVAGGRIVEESANIEPGKDYVHGGDHIGGYPASAPQASTRPRRCAPIAPSWERAVSSNCVKS